MTRQILCAVKVALSLVVVLATGCSSRFSRASDTFRIGLITPLTGEVQDLGKEMLASAQLAVDEANSRSAVTGPKFELVARDDQGSAASAALACRALIQDPGTVALIAAGTSSVAKAIIEATKNDQIPVLTSTATASDLLNVGGAVFRVIPPNSAQGEALAKFARTIGDSAAILFEQDDYSADLKNDFRRSFVAQGGRITGEAAFESDETAFRAQLDQLRSARPAVILAAAQHVPVARVLIRAREMKILQPVLAGETAFTGKLLAALGKTQPGRFYLTGAAVDMNAPPPNLSAFMKRFEAKNGKRPGIYGSYTYDTVGVLTSLLGSGNVKDRAELIAALRGLKAYDGVTGPIAFGSNGDVQRTYAIYTVRNGAFIREADGSPATNRQ